MDCFPAFAVAVDWEATEAMLTHVLPDVATAGKQISRAGICVDQKEG